MCLNSHVSFRQDEPTETFVPSTWRADATPTRPAMRNPSPEKAATSDADPQSPKKNVSFSQSRRKDVYQYPVEAVEEEFPSPARRQWGAPVNPVLIGLDFPAGNNKDVNKAGRYADLADWDFSVEDEGQIVNDSGDGSKESEIAMRLAKPARPSSLSSHPLTSSEMYRLGGVEDEDDEDVLQDVSDRENEEFFKGNWPSQFGQGEFQPEQFFPDWEGGQVSDFPAGAKDEQQRQGEWNRLNVIFTAAKFTFNFLFFSRRRRNERSSSCPIGSHYPNPNPV